MAVNLSPIWGAGAQLFDNSGNVLSGGKIYTYAAGTTTPATTYTISNGLTANSNPIILNSAGRVPFEIWLTDGQVYKFVLKDSNDTLIATYDNLIGINSNYIAFTMQQEIQTATAGQTVFNLTTMQYQPGTNSLSVFVDGVNQYGPGAQYAYVETDTDTVTFVNGLHVGASVKFTTATSVSSNYANAAQVTYDPPFTDAVATNVEAKLSEFVSIKDFGAVGDDITDDTAAIQAAIDSGQSLYVPEGTYIVTTVTISNDILIQGAGPNSIFKRKANYETDNTNAGLPDNTMIDVVEFVNANFQNVTFDGNEVNQNVATPSGALLRAYDVTGVSGEVLSINVDNCSFLNTTRSAITVKAKNGGAGQEICTVTNSLFKDCRPGIGSGDPASANPSGFAPTFINVNDRFRLIATNNRFIYDGSVATGDYAPTAIRLTYVDATTTAAGERATISNNYFYRCGRSNYNYLGVWGTNNALGVVELYTIGNNVSVTSNSFETSYCSPVRGKSSLAMLNVVGNLMDDNRETAVSIGPMGATKGTQTGRVIISNNNINLADVSAIGITGDDTVTPDKISDIVITGNHVSGITNTVSSAGGNEGAIVVRYGSRIIISNNNVEDADANVNLDGIKVRGCLDAVIDGNNLTGIGGYGIRCRTLEEKAIITNNMVRSCGSAGIQIDSAGTPDVAIGNNVINTVVTHGVLVQNCGYATLTGNIVLGVSGSSRGYYIPTTATKVTVQGNVTDATTPIFYTASNNVTVAGNSWNPSVGQRATNPPTGGTWSVGDIVWRTDPVSGQEPGWVCVTAGTPGTWKAMANLA